MVAKGFKGRLNIGLKQQELNSQDLLTTLNHIKNFSAIYFEEDEDSEDEPVQFVACGADEVYDADMNYSLKEQIEDFTNEEEEESKCSKIAGKDKKYKYIKPLQAPINPPYLAYLQSQHRDQNILQSLIKKR